MKFFLPIFLLMLSYAGANGQTAHDRVLTGLRGNVKTVETSTQETDRNGKPVYPLEKQSTDEYDRGGALVKTTHHVSGGRTTYFIVDGKRVSRYETFDASKVKMVQVPVDTVIPPQPPKQKGDPGYEYRYEYKLDSSGRVVAIERYNNDGSLRDTRKFTYDNSGRIAAETLVEAKGPSFGDVYKYDVASGVVLQRNSVFYLATGEKDVTPFHYSKIKFDTHGNWLYRVVTQGNGDDAEVIAIETRKITYH